MEIQLKLTRSSNAKHYGVEVGTVISIDIEDYISSVTASEIGNADVEACKAQAIAARTFVMNYFQKGKPVVDTSSAQAFRVERMRNAMYPNVEEAVNSTAGMILTYDGKLISTCSYCHSNGGKTVSSKEKWGGYRAWLIEQDDPWDYALTKGQKVGHGVGMSQQGAKYAASIGKTYKEILAFYYPGTSISKLNRRDESMSNYDPQKVIDIAIEEIGYLEKETHSQLDDDTANAGDKNHTKYARDQAKIPYLNGSKCGVAWCAVFVCWCFVQAYGEDAARKLLYHPATSKANCAAGCGFARNYFKNKKKLYNSPQPGDQIFFWASNKESISHTGLVVAVDSTYVYTVEGNTSAGKEIIPNGGAVCKKSYKLSNARIAGYGRPNWGIETKEEPIMTNTYPYSAKVTTSGGILNMRVSPSTSSSRVYALKNGTQITVTADAGNGWLKVQYQGKEGYCMATYLTAESASPDKDVTITLPANVASALLVALSNATKE